MKHLIYIYAYACACMLLLFSSCGGSTEAPAAVSPIDTMPLMLRQIQQCSRLYTAECKVHKIITHDDVPAMKGRALGKDFSIDIPLGKRKIAIPVDATLKAYIDMSAITPEDIVREGDRVEVRLPKPHVVMVSSTVDHDNVKQFVSLLRGRFSDEELTSYEQQGRKAIIADIPNLGILDMARSSAARQLIPIISQMGFPQENITITFVESDNKKGGISWVLD